MVNTTEDELNSDGDCSLREAITAANTDAPSDACPTGGGEDTIVFGVSGKITLGSTLPTISDSEGLTVDGEGQDITISGDGKVRVLEVSGVLTVRNLTVANGFYRGGGGGGGGIENSGTLRVENSTFSQNKSFSGNGGGIGNTGTLTVENSTFSQNEATNSGGAISGGNNLLTVEDSTFSENSADSGGGIFKCTYRFRISDLEVKNSTFSGNSAKGRGGGITNAAGGNMKATNTTFSENGAREGGGIFNDEGNVARLRGTIMADSLWGGNCAGSISDKGHNVDDGKSCKFRRANDSKPKTDPRLDPNGLQDNGGPTKTIALQPGSPAVDAVAQDVCPPPSTDQRGILRPQDGDSNGSALCDIGAFKLEGTPNPTRASAP